MSDDSPLSITIRDFLTKPPDPSWMKNIGVDMPRWTRFKCWLYFKLGMRRRAQLVILAHLLGVK